MFACIFQAVLCGMGVLLSIFAFASRHLEVHLAWLPWDAQHQPAWVLALSAVGLICVGVAVLRHIRMPLVLFSAIVLYLLARGLFLNSQYAFSTPASVTDGSLLVAGAFLAFLGSWPIFGKREPYRGRH